MRSFLERALRILDTRCAVPSVSGLRLEIEMLRRPATPAMVEPPATPTVVVLAPHMDDEVFGCGGTIARCATTGVSVRVIYLTDGGKGYAGPVAPAGLHETRKDEARRAGKILGLGEPVFLDFPDGALAATSTAVSRLAEALADAQPGAVYLPFMADLHPDHVATNTVFVAAASLAGLRRHLPCWGYEVWTPIVANTVVDVTETFDLKRAAMEAFESQGHDYAYPRAIEGLNTYRSLLRGRGRGYAEAFYVADLALYRALYETVRIGAGGRR
jgi:LmbE family N-acetylglucosaminyl deacetylase